MVRFDRPTSLFFFVHPALRHTLTHSHSYTLTQPYDAFTSVNERTLSDIEASDRQDAAPNPIKQTEPPALSFAPFSPIPETPLYLLPVFLVLAYFNTLSPIAPHCTTLPHVLAPATTAQHKAQPDTQGYEAMAVSGLLASKSFFHFFLFFS